VISISLPRLTSRINTLARFGALPGGGVTRMCWSPSHEEARAWLLGEMRAAGLETWVDPAGNVFGATGIRAIRPETPVVLTGSHIDTVPEGGILDGALGVLAGLECLHAIHETRTPHAKPLVVAAWSDEEGRYGSLFGSRAFCGMLEGAKLDEMAAVDGVRLVDAMASAGFDAHRAPEARVPAGAVAAYLELHIEQGPVLERLDLPLGAVLGTFGVERHAVRFTGLHAHAGSTPMDVRRDAFLTAARSALAWREDALARDDVRATTGIVKVSPGIVTAFNGTCELSLDQRSLDAEVLADMLARAQEVSREIAAEEGCEVEWERIWQIEPIPFDAELIDLADAVIADVAGTSTRLPSGPLHDAAEMARVVPTVMLFVKSLRGLSHTKEEDTPVEDLELSVRALHELTRRTLAKEA